MFAQQWPLRNAFTVVPRLPSSVETILKNRKFESTSGLIDLQSIVDVGGQFNCDCVIVGSIISYPDPDRIEESLYLLHIAIISTENLTQLGGFTSLTNGQNIDVVKYMLSKNAWSIANGIASYLLLDTSKMPTLAVLPFTISADFGTAQDADMLSQFAATYFSQQGNYSVMPRTTAIQKVMDEHKIQRSGLTDQNSIKTIGNALGAQYVLSGQIRKLANDYIMTLSIYDIGTGAIIDGNSHTVRSMQDIIGYRSPLEAGIEAFYKQKQANTFVERENTMVAIKGDSFIMGSPENEPGRSDIETQHRVILSDFLMSKYEITQQEYERVMGNNPSEARGAYLPVNNVMWYDAIEYCNKRSVLERLKPVYEITGNFRYFVKVDVWGEDAEMLIRGAGFSNLERGWSDFFIGPFNNREEAIQTIITLSHKGLRGETVADVSKIIVTWNKSANGYRLPTESEWEYASRAGTETAFPYGNKISIDDACFKLGWDAHTAVGSYKPNQFGLYDMQGSVREWCWDLFGYYPLGTQTNPSEVSTPIKEDLNYYTMEPVESVARRVIRGGAIYDSITDIRSAARKSWPPNNNHLSIGFRVVRSGSK